MKSEQNLTEVVSFDPKGLASVLAPAAAAFRTSRVVMNKTLAGRLIKDRYKGVNPFDNLFDFTNENMTPGTRIGVLFGVDVVLDQFCSPDTFVVHIGEDQHTYTIKE